MRPDEQRLGAAEQVVTGYEQMDWVSDDTCRSVVRLIALLQRYLVGHPWQEADRPRVEDLTRRIAERSYQLGQQAAARRMRQ